MVQALLKEYVRGLCGLLWQDDRYDYKWGHAVSWKFRLPTRESFNLYSELVDLCVEGYATNPELHALAKAAGMDVFVSYPPEDDPNGVNMDSILKNGADDSWEMREALVAHAGFEGGGMASVLREFHSLEDYRAPLGKKRPREEEEEDGSEMSKRLKRTEDVGVVLGKLVVAAELLYRMDINQGCRTAVENEILMRPFMQVVQQARSGGAYDFSQLDLRRKLMECLARLHGISDEYDSDNTALYMVNKNVHDGIMELDSWHVMKHLRLDALEFTLPSDVRKDIEMRAKTSGLFKKTNKKIIADSVG